MFKRKAVETLRAIDGITATNEDGSFKFTDAELKKAFFKAAATPLANAKVADLRAAIAGDDSKIFADDAAAAAAKGPKKEKAPKAPKEPKPVKEPETAEAALARIKADPKTAERWKRVVRVTEMGKRGPTRVDILCDNKGENGEDLYRNIAVQDVFQVKYSADYSRKAARSARQAAKAAAKAAKTQDATAGGTTEQAIPAAQ